MIRPAETSQARRNPFLASGAIAGHAYIEREADKELLLQLEDNGRFPFFIAPRQSGKSSLLVATANALPPARYFHVMVDLSDYVPTSFEGFWERFLRFVAACVAADGGLQLALEAIDPSSPGDTFRAWARALDRQLVVFIDEIGSLMLFEFREQIFMVFRQLANNRAKYPELLHLQFVFAGAIYPDRLISNRNVSPFNVAIEIVIDQLTLERTQALCDKLGVAGAKISPAVAAHVFAYAGGSVFLSQLLLEKMWTFAMHGGAIIDIHHVDIAAETIVKHCLQYAHFKSIATLVTEDEKHAGMLKRRIKGEGLNRSEHAEFAITGLRPEGPLLWNGLYARIFGPGGPLDLGIPPKRTFDLIVPVVATAALTRSNGSPPNPPLPFQLRRANRRLGAGLGVTMMLFAILLSPYTQVTPYAKTSALTYPDSIDLEPLANLRTPLPLEPSDPLRSAAVDMPPKPNDPMVGPNPPPITTSESVHVESYPKMGKPPGRIDSAKLCKDPTRIDPPLIIEIELDSDYDEIARWSCSAIFWKNRNEKRWNEAIGHLNEAAHNAYLENNIKGLKKILRTYQELGKGVDRITVCDYLSKLDHNLILDGCPAPLEAAKPKQPALKL